MRNWFICCCTGLVAALLVPPASAHPVPKDNRDRTLILRPTVTGLVVDLRLEVDESRAGLDLPREELVGVKGRAEFHAAFARYFEKVLGEGLAATLDGKELAFRATGRHHVMTDHLRCDYRFEAPWQLEPGQEHVLRFRESNYPLDDMSQLHLTFAPPAGVKARQVVAPDDQVLARKPDQRQPGDREKLRRVSAVLEIGPESLPGEARPALGPDTSPVRGSPAGRARRYTGKDKPVSGEVVAAHRGGTYEDREEPDHGHWRLLHLLLDTRQGLVLLLVLAAFFGAVHALTPGHGKTLVAAYLVGEKGTVWHAVVLGVVTTLTHTSSVLLLALVLPLLFPGTPPASLQAALGLIGGLLIAGTGLWLLMQRLAGRADHYHFDSDDSKPGWWQLIALGISGGIVPCWDAIAMLGLAIAAQRLWLGLPLLLAFSAGLASVLVAVGIAVVRAREYLLTRGRPEDGEVRLGRWDVYLDRLGKVLPVLSAVLIIGIGLWLCFESARSVG